MESILNSIKKLLGVSDNDTNFDVDIIMHINSVFTILRELGVSPNNSFSITNMDETWDDYIVNSDTSYLKDGISISEIVSVVKVYIYLRVRLLFDPPTSGIVTESLKQMITELEWRINDMVDIRKET